MSVFDIFEQLEAASGSNEKVAILKKHKDNAELVELLDAALNFKRKFYIKKFNIEQDEDAIEDTSPEFNYEDFIDLLKELQDRSISGAKAIARVQDFFVSCNDLEAKWYSRVLLKDLRCNFGISLCEKAGIHIPEFEVMLAKDGKECKKFKEIVASGVYASPKLNGYRCFAISDNGNVTLHSRNGLVYENFPQVVEALEKIGGSFRVDGEIMSHDFNAMQQTAMSSKSNKTVGDIKFHIFGWVPVDEWDKQEFSMLTKERLENCKSWYETNESKIKDVTELVEHKLIYTVEEALEFERECIAAGYEGAMLLPNIPYYVGKKTNKLLKLKTFHTWDCKVLNIYEGTGKYVGMMGGITVLQENGVECDLGTGWSDEDREYMWNNQSEFIGRTVEVQYQEIQEPHKRMQFPSFVRWRNDK